MMLVSCILSIGAVMLATFGWPIVKGDARGALIVYGAWGFGVVGLALAAVVALRGWP